MTYQNILNIVALLVIGFIAYTLLIKILEFEPNSKRKRLSKVLNHGKEQDTRLLAKFPFLKYLLPSYVMERANDYNRVYTKRLYAMQFLMGTMVGVIGFFVYFKAYLFLIPLSLLGGVFATLVKLHTFKRDYLLDTDYNLSEYMSSFTTAYATFASLRGAIESILPMVDETIRGPLESAYLRLGEGKSVEQAFYDFQTAFPQKEVRLFHKQLQANEDSRKEKEINDVTLLRRIAEDMSEKEVFKKDLAIVTRGKYKQWRLFCILVFSLPFIFIVVSYDNFLLIQNHMITGIVFLLAGIYSLYVFKKILDFEVFDPTQS